MVEPGREAESVLNAGYSMSKENAAKIRQNGEASPAAYEAVQEFEGDGAIGANEAYGNMAGNQGARLEQKGTEPGLQAE